MITLSALQLALLAAGAAAGWAMFSMIGCAYGIVMSVFIHHGFAAPDPARSNENGTLPIRDEWSGCRFFTAPRVT